MSLEHFKTQVLLLHSEQSTLENLSTGFSDRYTVHCATSGSEALTTLGEVSIHVIVSAQDLPGMSGLEALREAQKRSPDTIGILLADDASNDVEALVGEKDMFQVVSETVTPKSLRKLIDSATQRSRLLALAKSANDTTAADPADSTGEHIIMETAENGSTIISDATGRMPILNPEKVAPKANVGARSVELLVLSQDEEFVKTVGESSRGVHQVRQASSVSQADEMVKSNKVGVAILDAALVGSNLERVALHLRNSTRRLVPIVAGRREDGEMLMDLINRGKVYRFLLKPVSPGRARLAIEASVRHHLEAPDSAFRTPDAGGAAQAAAVRAPKAPSKPATVTKDESASKPKTAASPKSADTEAQPGPVVAKRDDLASFDVPEIRAEPRREQSVDDSRSPPGNGPGDSGGEESSAAEALTGIFKTLGIEAEARNDADAAEQLAAGSSAGSLLSRPMILGIAATVFIALIGAGWWLFGGSGEDVSAQTPVATTPVTDESEPVAESRESVQPEPVIDIDSLLSDAREAVDDGRIFNPPGGNAIELYLTAAAAAPGVEQVATELAATIDRALGMAEAALLERRSAETAAALERVALADPNNSRLPFLNRQLEEFRLRDYLAEARAAISDSRFEAASRALNSARTIGLDDTSEIDALAGELQQRLNDQRAAEILGQANARFQAGDLVTPADNSAAHYYRLALGLDPENAVARQGLNAVASKLVLQARAGIDSGEFGAAESLLADARGVDPDSAELANADAALAAARERVARERREAQRLAAEKAAAERAAAERAERERRAAAERAERERLAAERAAAERARAERLAAELEAAKRAEAERLALERAAAQRAAAERLAVDAPQRSQAASPPAATATEQRPQASRSTGGSAQPQPRAAQTTAASQPPPEPEPATRETPANNGDARQAGAAETPGGRVTSAPVPVSSLKRTKYVAPKYPRAAQRRNLTGYVDVVFTVDTDGSVKDINVIGSEPGNTFVDAAVNAVEDWTFEPVSENGSAVAKRAAVRMMFALE